MSPRIHTHTCVHTHTDTRMCAHTASLARTHARTYLRLAFSYQVAKYYLVQSRTLSYITVFGMLNSLFTFAAALIPAIIP